MDRTESGPDPTPLTVRRLLVDLSQGFERHWNGGDAWRTAYANALSMSFPVGEQCFIDSVRNGVARLPDEPRWQPLREVAQGFIGQEATHRRLHGLFNAELQRQGLHNAWEPRAAGRIAWARAMRARCGSQRGHLHELAITAALEHFTAVFGDFTLRYQGTSGDWFANATPMLQTLWRWHAAEETEHKSVAFDLYRALGGTNGLRMFWFFYAGLLFSSEAMIQTCSNLHRDGTLWRPSTWWSAARFFFGFHGLVWRCALPLLAYFRPGFHPQQSGDPALASQWLQAHAKDWTTVGGAAAG